MGGEVAIQMLHSGDVDKQRQVCLEFAVAQGWRPSTISPPGHADEVVNLVDQGLIDVVVLPFVNRESLTIEARVTEVGGKVAYCRQSSERYNPDADTSAVIAYVYRKGRRDVNEIAQFLRVSAERVKRALRRRR